MQLIYESPLAQQAITHGPNFYLKHNYLRTLILAVATSGPTNINVLQQPFQNSFFYSQCIWQAKLHHLVKLSELTRYGYHHMLCLYTCRVLGRFHLLGITLLWQQLYLVACLRTFGYPSID